LGIKTIREAQIMNLDPVESTGANRAFRQGIVVEALNPKTAAFFLAFIPQFIEPDAGHVALQFAVLGLISVTLNTAADIAVVFLASAARRGISREPHFTRRLRQGSGLIISALGLSLALSSRPGTGIDP
jgi:threonine/homoserine/homoserine lactone efflux protein